MGKTINVLWVARYDYNSNWKLARHNHDYFQIIYFLSGKGTIFIGKKNYPIESNRLVLIKPGELHGLQVTADCAVKTLDLKFQLIDQELSAILLELPDLFDLQSNEIEDCLSQIKNEGLTRDFLYKDFSELYLQQILLILFRMEHVNSGGRSCETAANLPKQDADTALGKVFQFIEAHYSQPFTLDTLSKEIGYSKSYICQRTRKDYGKTPMQLIYEYKISKSKQLIIFSDYPLKEIALKSGFENIHHFTRIFKKLTGVTPGAYRNAERDQIRKDIYFDDRFVNVDLTQKQTGRVLNETTDKTNETTPK